MKRRPSLILWSFLAILLAGGAGILGKIGAAPIAPAETPAPATVKVTRGEVSRTISAPGELVAARVIHLGMEAGGALAEIRVEPGDAVRAGQILARIGSREGSASQAGQEKLAAAVEAANLERIAAQQALDALYADLDVKQAAAWQAYLAAREAYSDTVRARAYLGGIAHSPLAQAAREALEDAQALARRLRALYRRLPGEPDSNPEKAKALSNLKNARRRAARAQALVDRYRGEPGSAELERADAEVALARASLAKARRDYESLQEGPDSHEVELAGARLAAARAQAAAARAEVEAARAAREALVLRAPFEGVVLEVGAQTGEWVAAGEGFITLSDPRALEVQASIVEEAFPQAKAGMQAELYFDALPEVSIQGALAQIVPRRLPGDRPLYPVTIQLDRLPAGLAPGMTVDAAIVVERRADVLRLPRALLRAGAQDELTVRVWQAGQEVIRTIRLGLRGDLYVEILDGLREGEEVIGP
jgi:RND family efflux transporter MFP subunit